MRPFHAEPARPSPCLPIVPRALRRGRAPMTPRVAVIGTGRWGRNLVRNFASLGALAALCDRDPEVLADLVARFPGALAQPDVEALLADPGIDAVAIATPSGSHGALARRALEAGKAVYVEKPLCMDPAEGLALGDLADARGLTLMTGHLLLYHPAFVALRDFVRDGGLGDLRYVYSHRLNFRGHAGEDDALWDFGPHDLSMILALADELPVRVSAGGGASVHPRTADTVIAHLDFPAGLQAHLFVSWVHPFKEQRLVVVGEGGTAVFDDVLPGPRKLQFHPHLVEWSGEAASVIRAEGTPIPYGTDEPLAVECGHFLDCIVTARRPRSDAREATRVLAVLDACARSLALHASVAIERGD